MNHTYWQFSGNIDDPRKLLHKRSDLCHSTHRAVPFFRAAFIVQKIHRLSQTKQGHSIRSESEEPHAKLQDLSLLKRALKNIRKSLNLFMYKLFCICNRSGRMQAAVGCPPLSMEIVINGPKGFLQVLENIRTYLWRYLLPRSVPSILAAGGHLSLLVGLLAYRVSCQSGSFT